MINQNKLNKFSLTFKFLLLVILLIIFLFGTFTFIPQSQQVYAQQPSTINQTPINYDGSVGMGLAGVSDWGTQYPFLNMMKTARPWNTKCGNGSPVDCTENNTGEFDKLNLDENKYPKTLPAVDDTSVRYRWVETPILSVDSSKRPFSKYVALWDGEGKLEISYGVIKAESSPNRIVFDIAPKNGYIYVRIKETDPNKNGNYIRNIRVVPFEYEQEFLNGAIFNPVWLDKMKSFKQFRFMDWLETNHSSQSKWADRPKVDDYLWQEFGGVPWEIVIELANQAMINPWINIPHLADKEYITELAKLFKEKLDPRLKVYIEFSNEVWNWNFKQTQDANTFGRQRWAKDTNNDGVIDTTELAAAPGESYLSWQGMKIQEMCNTWKNEVFLEKDKTRVKCITGSQTNNSATFNKVLECPLYVAENPNNKPCHTDIDILAMSAYFNGGLTDDTSLQALKTEVIQTTDREALMQKLIQQIKDGSSYPAFNSTGLAEEKDNFEKYKKMADKYNMDLAVYEGGTHITANGKDLQNDADIIRLFIELNRRPEMYDIYTELLTDWKNSGGTIFNHFVDVDEPSKWGSWGSMEYLNKPIETAYITGGDIIDLNFSGKVNVTNINH
jgi:hypothetical protein